MSRVAKTSLIANQLVVAARLAKAFGVDDRGPGSATPATIAFRRNALQLHFVDPLDCLTRREAARLLGGTAAALCFSRKMAHAQRPSDAPITRRIPSSGEKLPVIGLGTWQTFDVDPAQSAPLAEVLSTFVKLGGRVIDSSPMYGRAEQVIGDLVTKLKLRDSLFLATKVWTRGRQAGIDSIERSFARLQTKTIDLMQVHNLVDAETQLRTIREWKAQGRFRYLGITHHEAGAFPEVAKILAREKVDFVQINYSIMEREADEKILPLAQERGIGVIINRPFDGGNLFSRVRGKPLPDFAAEFDCTSWAQFFLKWIVAHPAVTCAIPATKNVQHIEDNMHAGVGKLPDAKTRQRMIEAISNL
jgi:aryl-alcohol dehydrogenase-like predicted oxidoreductase